LSLDQLLKQIYTNELTNKGGFDVGDYLGAAGAGAIFGSNDNNGQNRGSLQSNRDMDLLFRSSRQSAWSQLANLQSSNDLFDARFESLFAAQAQQKYPSLFAQQANLQAFRGPYQRLETRAEEIERRTNATSKRFKRELERDQDHKTCIMEFLDTL
jgi:hypothetical protein